MFVLPSRYVWSACGTSAERPVVPSPGSSFGPIRTVAPSPADSLVRGHRRAGYLWCVIIVAGWLHVAAEDRGDYLAACLPVIEAARAANGCLDFHLTPDPLEPERINVFEQWESVAELEAFRGAGLDVDARATIVDAHVEQHAIASTDLLT